MRARTGSLAGLVALSLSLLCSLPAAVGAPADPFTEEYKYDALGRLEQSQQTGASSNTLEVYSYDAAGNRLVKAVGGTIFTLSGTGHFDAGVPQEVTISRIGSKSLAQRVELNVKDVTAAAGVEYLYWMASAPSTVYSADETPISVNFAVDQEEATLVIEAYPSVDYGDSLEVEISSPQDYSGGSYVASVDAVLGVHDLTYVVGDVVPPVSTPATFVFVGSVTVAEGGTATVTVKRLGDLSTAHNLTVKTIEGSATSGTDYTAVSTTVSFAANDIYKNVSVPIATDATSEIDEYLSVVIQSVTNNGVIGSPDSATITIQGTSSPASTMRVLDAVVNEGGQATVRFIRDGNLSTAQTFRIYTMSGSAGSSDYTLGSTSPSYVAAPSFAIGQRIYSYSFTTTQDALTEGDEYFWVWAAYQNSTTPGFTDPIARVTIVDDESAPSAITPTSPVSFAFTGDVTVAEGATATVTIERTGDTTSNHTVLVQAIDNNALSNNTTFATEDYIPVSRALYFAPGETSKTVSVETLTDSQSETDETFMVAISSVNNSATVGNPGVAIVTITGSGPAASTIRVLDASVNEGGAIGVQFVRDGDLSAAQTFRIYTMSGSAGSSDYTLGSTSPSYVATPSFAIGQRIYSYSFTTTQDALTEGNEYFWVWAAYQNSTTPGFTDPIARVTIIDDETSQTDIQPTSPVSYAFAGNVSVTEGQIAAVTINRTGDTASTHNVAVSVIPTTASAVDPHDYIPVYNQVMRFEAGETSKTVSVETFTDSTSEIDETLTVAMTSVSNGGTVGTPDSSLITITGSGGASQTVAVADATVTEGSNVNIQFTRSSSSGSLSIKWATASGSAIGGTDFTSVSPTTKTFSGGSTTVTATLTTTSDSTVEGDEYLWVYATPNSGNTPGFTDPIARVKIVDDDTASSMSIADTSVSEGNSTTVTITRSGTATAVYQEVNYQVLADTGDTAGSGDFTAATGKAIFMPGDTTATVNVATTEDVSVEGSEVFSVKLTTADTYTTFSDDKATVTITDDE